MKIRIALLALAALVANVAFAASPFAIYFNTADSTSCYVSNVTGTAIQPDGSVLATALPSPIFSSACGLSSGTAPIVSLSIAPASINAGNSGTATLNWSANHVTSCTATGTDSSVAAEFPGQWVDAAVVCGTGINHSCTGVLNNALLTPIANGTNGNYNFGIQCSAGATGAFATASVAVTGSTNTGGTPSANFTSSTNGLTASFTDTSTNTGGTNGSWSWNFGDSATSTQQNPSHTYNSLGTYNVQLTVTDSVNPSNNSTKLKQVTVTSGLTSCTTGAIGDVPGYTALCSGYMTLHAGVDTRLGPSAYSFPFVFGADWPGSRFGLTQIFTMAGTQFLSIPFIPSPGHTISISENQTYTGYAITFSISTSMGLFNNGSPGNGVLCVRTNNPGVQITSNNAPQSCANLDPNTQYWFNVIPSKYSTTQGRWVKSCTSSSCQLGLGQGLIN